ncbi:hypothetical protein BDN70DRAFT_889725 [Pholiota conissans]|uniref:HNH nuclease domain-containing protein n=1 Tax=Pholiota conissans TaxID=109636 RepID=A0A9P5ZEL5_9AGAR|nr:hypothetical protein BDN70DRAFT_889725 [Pholiota conissans]
MTTLPREVPLEVRNHIDISSAYTTCLNIEETLQQITDDISKIDLIYIRVLGYLMHYLPTDRGTQGIEVVSREINSAPNNAAILKIGKMYLEDFIMAFRPNKGHSDRPSDDSSWPSTPSHMIDMIDDEWVEAPLSSQDARRNALIRDGYRCVITGRYDPGSLERIKGLWTKAQTNVDVTRCAYIFVPPARTTVKLGSDERGSEAALWTVLESFGYGDLSNELKGSQIHRFENIMTLSALAFYLFNELNMWFVKTDTQNKYKLEATELHTFLIHRELASSGYVTFKSPDPKKLPVPSPTYLGIHAACAKVGYKSGASKYIDEVARQKDQDDEDDDVAFGIYAAESEMLNLYRGACILFSPWTEVSIDDGSKVRRSLGARYVTGNRNACAHRQLYQDSPLYDTLAILVEITLLAIEMQFYMFVCHEASSVNTERN